MRANCDRARRRPLRRALETTDFVEESSRPARRQATNGTGLSGSLAAALFQAVDPRPQLHGR